MSEPPTASTGSGPDLRGAGALGVAWALLPALMGFWLLAKIGPVSEWLLEHPTRGLVIYVSVFMVSSGAGLLPTYAQAILGGWVFGMIGGLPAALAGFVGGALIGYVIARLVARDRVQQAIDANVKARAVRDALIGHGFWRTLGTVALLRVPPNSPFALTNLAMASSRVPLPAFLIGTGIGMAPRTAVAVGLASAAARTGADDIYGFIKGQGLLVFLIGLAVLFVCFGIIGAIGKRAIDRVVASPKAACTDDAQSEDRSS